MLVSERYALMDMGLTFNIYLVVPFTWPPRLSHDASHFGGFMVLLDLAGPHLVKFGIESQVSCPTTSTLSVQVLRCGGPAGDASIVEGAEHEPLAQQAVMDLMHTESSGPSTAIARGARGWMMHSS